MTTTSRHRALAILLATAAALTAIVLPATAASARADGEDVPKLKAALTQRIELRLDTLARLATVVGGARVLTDEHRAELSATIAAATDGLTRLKQKVADETTVAGLRSDATAMVHDYRVFTLVGPQVRLSIAGDATALALDRAGAAYERLAAAVADKEGSHGDADAHLERMRAAIDSARDHLDGQVATLLAIEPGPDTVAIRNGVASVQRQLSAARGDLRTAHAEGRAVLRLLRPGR